MRTTSFGSLAQLDTPMGKIEFLSFERSGRPHRHNTKETIFVTNGRGIVHIEGKKFEVSKGDTLTIDENVTHYMEPSLNETLEFILWYS